MSPNNRARLRLPSGWALAAAAGLLALVLHAAALRTAWSDNLAYLRLDALLNRTARAVTLQAVGTPQDWRPAAWPATAPERFVAAYGLGLTDLAQHSYAPAIVAFQTAVEAYPEYPGTHALLADAYRGVGDDNTAVTEWRAAQALPLLLSRGEARGRTGDWPGAVGWYVLATRVDPQSAAAFWQLGLAYGAAGNQPAQIEALQTAVTLAPEDAQIHHALGLAYFQQGALEAAATQFQRALALNPNDFYTNLYLAGVELGLGDFDAAETYARQSTRLDPSNPRAHFALGSVYARRAQWPAAINELNTALSLIEPWNRQSSLPLGPTDQRNYHLLLAQSYQAASQPAPAIAEYQAVLSLDPKNAAAAAALKALQAPGQP